MTARSLTFGDRISDRIAYLVESTGCEISVTLVLQGRLVAGFLTRPMRYYEEFQRLYALVTITGDPLQERTTAAPTEVETAAAAEQWEAAHPAWRDEVFTFPELCLRNALIRDAGGNSQPIAYLLVQSDQVAGLSVGFSNDLCPCP